MKRVLKKLWFDRTPDDFYRLLVLDLFIVIVVHLV